MTIIAYLTNKNEKRTEKDMKKPILNISYSKLFDLPIPWNTAELYETACELGFDAIKGDVTPSSDGKLIMCHDSYFRLNENGRVLEPGNKGAHMKLIKNMTSKECTALEYANEEAKEYLGYYAKVAELEDLIRICKKHGKIAYITVRDKQIEMCVYEIYRLLQKYNMVDHCIINSFSTDTLNIMKQKVPEIKLSLVFGPNRMLTKRHIDRASALGNCAVCLFWTKDVLLGKEMLRKSQNAIIYAKEKCVELHFAHGHDKESYNFGIECGFSGFQCIKSDAFK